MTQTDQRELRAELAATLRLARDARRALRRQRTALTRGDYHGLVDQSQGLERLVDAIARATRSLTTRVGVPDVEALAAAMTTRGLGEAFERLLTLAEECRELNAGNGALLRLRRTRLNESGRQLGLAPGDPTYDEVRGTPTRGASTRSLGLG